MKLFGYKRSDGKIGIRNHVLILPVSICASDVARKVHEQVKGTVTFHNHLGCSQSMFDQECTIRTMAGMAANPNVYGTILISLGCENCQLNIVQEEIEKRTNKPLFGFSIQKCGGATRTLDKVLDVAFHLTEEAKKQEKIEIEISDLIIGTECGGSDPTSGLASNVLVGNAMDHIVENGGTVILSETTEFIGAEHNLIKRAKNNQVVDQILQTIEHYEQSQKVIGYDIRQRNPSPGNKKGGITTLEEKSLGCILKGGSKTIQKVFDYAEEIDETGLVIMDTPGNDSTSMMGMVAGGCQMILFTTGRGTPMGNPLVPVIKICANPETCIIFEEHIDYDASYLLLSKKTMNESIGELMNSIENVVIGEQTKSEKLGFYETSIVRVGKYIKDNEVYSYYY